MAFLNKFFSSSSVPQAVLTEDELDPVLYTGKPAYIRRFVMELANHCNLRCRYCHQSRPDFKPIAPLNNETFENILEYLAKHPLEVIDLTGGGDILMAPDWAKKCDRLLELGIKLDTTINLGKILEDHEIETIAKFNIITVSIDTIDREILAAVRRKVDIRTIMYNMMRIKGASLRNGNTKLHWIVSAVYSAEVVLGLPKLAAYAVAFGAKTFQFQDLMVFNDISDNVKSVWELKGEEAIEAVKATREATNFAKKNGLILQMPPHFFDRLDKFEKTAHEYIASGTNRKLEAA